MGLNSGRQLLAIDGGCSGPEFLRPPSVSANVRVMARSWVLLIVPRACCFTGRCLKCLPNLPLEPVAPRSAHVRVSGIFASTVIAGSPTSQILKGPIIRRVPLAAEGGDEAGLTMSEKSMCGITCLVGVCVTPEDMLMESDVPRTFPECSLAQLMAQYHEREYFQIP